jgi:hypothetical protein
LNLLQSAFPPFDLKRQCAAVPTNAAEVIQRRSFNEYSTLDTRIAC